MPLDASFAGDRWSDMGTRSAVVSCAYHANFLSFTKTCDRVNKDDELVDWVTNHGR